MIITFAIIIFSLTCGFGIFWLIADRYDREDSGFMIIMCFLFSSISAGILLIWCLSFDLIFGII